MYIKVVAIGQAGNSAGIDLIKNGLLEEKDILLVNSTIKDTPEDYRGQVILIDGSNSGCGKERDLSKQLVLGALEKGDFGKSLKGFIDEKVEQVLILSSTEGGTGSGAAMIVGKYISQVLKTPVQIFGFDGFAQDTRGLQNTLEYFQEADESLTVQNISNAKFLDEANGNILKAERLANTEFLTRFTVMTGRGRIDCSKNIDDMDLFKVVTTPGYMISGHSNLSKLKNVDQFNKFVSNMIDENKSLETSASEKRLAVIINASPETQEAIDYNWEVFKSKFGLPYETFSHIQWDEKQPEYISFIAAGLKMPIDIVKEKYEEYKQQSEKTDKAKDDFFSFADNLKGNSEDSQFNIGRKRMNVGNFDQEKESSFFTDFKKPKSQFSNTVSKDVKDITQDNGGTNNY